MKRAKGFFIVWWRVWKTTSGPLLIRLRATFWVWKTYGFGSMYES